MKDKSASNTCETFSNRWLTIQPSLFNFIEDEVGELDEEQKLFVRVAESLELRQIAARYGWCAAAFVMFPSSATAMKYLSIRKSMARIVPYSVISVNYGNPYKIYICYFGGNSL